MALRVVVTVFSGSNVIFNWSSFVCEKVWVPDLGRSSGSGVVVGGLFWRFGGSGVSRSGGIIAVSWQGLFFSLFSIFFGSIFGSIFSSSSRMVLQN